MICKRTSCKIGTLKTKIVEDPNTHESTRVTVLPAYIEDPRRLNDYVKALINTTDLSDQILLQFNRGEVILDFPEDQPNMVAITQMNNNFGSEMRIAMIPIFSIQGFEPRKNGDAF